MSEFRISRAIIATAIALVAAATACGSKETPERQQMTQRQKDSLLGASSIPGARGVQKALNVQDSAAAKRALLDSIAKSDSK